MFPYLNFTCSRNSYLFSTIKVVILSISFLLLYSFPSMKSSIVLAQAGGWASQDIGSVGVQGSMTESNGAFTVKGSGSDIWGYTDSFHFAYQTLNGDGEIIARVASVQNTAPNAKAGVMIRESLTNNSAHAFISMKAQGLLEFYGRNITSSYSQLNISGYTTSAPHWVRLRRLGNTLYAYRSANGITWTAFGSVSITMSSQVYIGLAVTSCVNTTLNSSIFDNVVVSKSQALTNPWHSQDVGNTVTAGNARQWGSGFMVQGAGVDIWGTNDSMHYTYQQFNGDGEIVARVTEAQKTAWNSKAGVMIRESLADNSAYAMVDYRVDNNIYLQVRASTGDITQGIAVSSSQSVPVWLKIKRVGNTFYGYRSTDGISWYSLGSYSINMASNVYIGMAVTSCVTTSLSTAIFDNVYVGLPTGGLQRHWKLDETEGTVATESIGSSLNGTLTGGPLWQTGKISGSLRFDGIDDLVDISGSAVNTQGDFTVSAWVNLNNLSAHQTAVSQDGTQISGFYLQYLNTGKFAFGMSGTDVTSTITRAQSTTLPVAGTWYHLTGVRDFSNGQLSLYVNGSLQGTASFAGKWNATGHTIVGAGKWTGARAEYWNGQIDDVRIYNRALRAEEIQALSTPAVVSIISPTNNSSFGQSPTINIEASATGSNGFSKVEFFVGSTKLGEDTTLPYTYSWSNVANGTYSLWVRATDNSGVFTNSSSITITVENSAPITNITSPIMNSTFMIGSNINITANVTDIDGSVTKVEFFQGITKICEDTVAPYNCIWSNVAQGNYTITVKATDNEDATTISDPVNITISGDKQDKQVYRTYTYDTNKVMTADETAQ
jgi:hypothetical protein